MFRGLRRYPYDLPPDIAPICTKYMLPISSRRLFSFGWAGDELLAPNTILAQGNVDWPTTHDTLSNRSKFMFQRDKK